MFKHAFIRLQLFFKKPKFIPLLLFNGLSCVVMDSIADCFEQKIIENRPTPYDYNRTFTFSATGFFGGCSDHIWYYLIEKGFPGRTRRNITIKVTLDQFFYSAFEIVGFFILYNLIDGKGYREGIDELKKKFVETLTVSYLIWPIAQIINFTFVPLSLRVIYSEVVSLVWSTYLSWVKHRDCITESDVRESSSKENT